jgi:hypothetical protein
LRKLFIVTVNVPSWQVWWRRVRGKDPDGYRLKQLQEARPRSTVASPNNP